MCQSCHDLYGVTGHLDEPTATEVSAHQNRRELALTELMVRTVALALHITFSEEQVRTVVEALNGDDRRFTGHADVTVASVLPSVVLDQIRLYGDLAG